MYLKRCVAILSVVLALAVGPAFAQSLFSAPEAPATEDTPTALQQLLSILEDDAARARLIEALRGVTVPAEAPPAAELPAPAPEQAMSFGRRIALITQEAAQTIAEDASRYWAQLSRAPQVFDGLSGNEFGVLLNALENLALVILGTIAVYVVLRWFGKILYRRMGDSARDGGVIRTVVLFVTSVLIDALIVIAAWAAGYALAILALGDFGTIGIRQTLYLNAFLLVEMAKVALRLVLSPSAPSLRLVPLGNRAARYLSLRLSIIVSLLGYGQLLIVPIINSNISFLAGRAVSTLIAVIVLAYAVYLVLRNRRNVSAVILGEDRPDPLALAQDPDLPDQEGGAAQSPPARNRRRGAIAYLVRHWHWPVLAYLMVLFFIVLIRPGDAVFRILVASGQVAVVALTGFAVSGLISRAMISGVVLPEGVTARLPLLERRLNRFVPRALRLLRLVIFVCVVLFAMNALSMIDLRAWMVSQIGMQMTAVVFSVLAMLLVSFVIWVALTSWVDYRLNPEFGQIPTSREKTLLTLLRNAATITLVIVTLMFVLAEIGLDIGPLLASAGVLGLAIGFGAQKMVQDIITGIFIQLENAMNVGDVVSVGGTTGSVERLTIRSASLRDVQGAYHIIPFSAVDVVTNYVRDFGYFVCDMGVAYRESVDDVKAAMLDAFAELRANPDYSGAIIADLEWFGLNSFGDSAVNLRARIKCVPGQQWAVGRAYNEVLKRVFDVRGIEIPFPHQTIFLGESKDGKTQDFKVDLRESHTQPV